MKSPHDLFGIECGSGWRSLYEPLIERCKREGVPILQIKEKFGTLRFYVGAASDDLRRAIEVAEEKSRRVCEQCGGEGHRFDDGWVRTLCTKCERKRK